MRAALSRLTRNATPAEVWFAYSVAVVLSFLAAAAAV